MDFLTWGRNPWGQDILTHISWNLFWASLFAGVMFFVAHASYMVLSAHRKRTAAETDAMEASRKDLPEKIARHSLVARLFHWVMAAAMFVLLFTAFLPVVGIQFAWVTWHWIAGLVLTASIVHQLGADTTTAFLARLGSKTLKFTTANSEATELTDRGTHSGWDAYGHCIRPIEWLSSAATNP